MYPDWVLNWGVSDETPLQVPTFIAQQASHNSKVTCLQGIREGPGMNSQLKVYFSTVHLLPAQNSYHCGDGLRAE